MVLYPNKLPESERVCFGICRLMMQMFDFICFLMLPLKILGGYVMFNKQSLLIIVLL